MMHVASHLPLEELKRLERSEKDANRPRRLRIVILGIEGGAAPAIARGVGLSRRICQRWGTRDYEQGLAGLDDLRGQKSEQPLTEQQRAAVCERGDAGPTGQDMAGSLRGKDVQRILAEEFGLLRSLSGVSWLLHRLGDSDPRPRPRHRNNGPAARDAFKSERPDRIKAIAAAHPGKRLRVDFPEESRFGQQGTTANVRAQRPGPTSGPSAARVRGPFARPNPNPCG